MSISDQEAELPDTSKRNDIKQELASMSFEELKMLKNELGSKVYNETVFGARNKRKIQKDFHRVNKNRPRETSSKVKVSTFREVIQGKRKVDRDPRFDDLSGEFNQTIHDQTYRFLGDIKRNEMEELSKDYHVEKNEENKKKMKMLLNRYENQERDKNKKLIDKQKFQSVKKEEIKKIKQGKKPYFVKKGVQKKQALAEKFQELKKSGKLQKYMERKRKKNAKLDKKKLPM